MFYGTGILDYYLIGRNVWRYGDAARGFSKEKNYYIYYSLLLVSQIVEY